MQTRLVSSIRYQSKKAVIWIRTQNNDCMLLCYVPQMCVVCNCHYDTEATNVLDLKCLFCAGVSGTEHC